MLIKIDIKEKRAQTLGSPVIVCGNTDDVVEFTFDEEWAASQTRTARFVYTQDGAVKYTDVVFNGDKCSVPLISNTKEVKVGVFAGELMTTTPAAIPCELSILCGTGTPEAPTPSQYDQIMALLNEKRVLDAVLFSSQELGEEQQSIARANIGAASQKDVETALNSGLQAIQDTQQQLGTTEQQLNKRITQNQTALSSLSTSTSEAVTNLQDQVDKKAEVDTFTLTWNEETDALETDEATLTALVEALDAVKNIKIIITRGSGQIHGYVASHVNRFLSAFDYMRRRLYTWRVYEDEIPLYHSIGLYDDSILERGETPGGWQIRKYESGDAECWGTITYKPTEAVAAGSGLSAEKDFPFTFVKPPYVFVHVTQNAYKIKNCYGYKPTANVCSVYAWLDSTRGLEPNEEVVFIVEAKGRWK